LPLGFPQLRSQFTGLLCRHLLFSPLPVQAALLQDFVTAVKGSFFDRHFSSKLRQSHFAACATKARSANAIPAARPIGFSNAPRVFGPALTARTQNVSGFPNHRRQFLNPLVLEATVRTTGECQPSRGIHQRHHREQLLLQPVRTFPIALFKTKMSPISISRPSLF